MEECWVAVWEEGQKSIRAEALVRRRGKHLQGGERDWTEGESSVLWGGRSDQDSRVREQRLDLMGKVKWVVGWRGSPSRARRAQLAIAPLPAPPPSGWDAETGTEDGLRPDVLVSLAAPKRCAGRFSGRHHFVAGRFVPDDVRRKFALRLPGYTGTDCVAAL